MLLLSEKEVMLSEISRILEVCKSIVSRLSCQDVNVSVKAAPTNIQHTTLCSDDDEMWWDQSDVSGHMSFDPNNNFYVGVDTILDDSLLEDIQLFPSDETDASDNDLEDSVAMRVKLRKLTPLQSSVHLGAVTNVPDAEEQQLASSDDQFIEKITSFINKSSPGNIFNAKKSLRRKKRKAAKMIHPELISLWKNVGDLFDPRISVPSTPDPSIPIVDWSRVNQRFIQNIPTPSPQPKHGVSNYPPFYKENKYISQADCKEGLFHLSKAPFGSELGYLTSAGVISHSSNTNSIHGYVWSDSFRKYILHAKFPGELERSEVSSKRRKKKRGSR